MNENKLTEVCLSEVESDKARKFVVAGPNSGWMKLK